MEQLIFIGVILLFTILEGIAKKGRAKGKGLPPGEIDPGTTAPRLPQMPRLPEPRSEPSRGEGLATYDEDPSYDDRVRAQGVARPGSGTSGSEGMVPTEVWEEILALARGGGASRRSQPGEGPPAHATPRPAPDPPRASRSEAPGGRGVTRRSLPGPAPRREARPSPPPEAVPDEPVHSVHLTHAKLGTPVHDRLSPIDTPHEAPENPNALAAREMMGGGRASLRQAVLLGEILGPPAALRGDPHDPQ